MKRSDFRKFAQRVMEKSEKFSVPAVQPKPLLQFQKWFKAQFVDWCNATALHGYSQVIRDGYTTVERSVWTVAVISSLISAITLLSISWSWNSETPTVTVTETTNNPTWNLPFPAITICNLNKISATVALARAATMNGTGNMTVNELSRRFRLFLHVSGLGKKDIPGYRQLHDIMLSNNLEIPQLMGEFAPPCSSMLERCMWKGTQWRCDNLFQVVNSTEGRCCAFNYYGLLKNNYLKKITVNIPKDPRRVTASGYQTGLSVLLQPFAEDYHSIDVASYGFKVLIHSSYDYPENDAEMKLIQWRTESFITVKPTNTYATTDTLALDPAVRNCYGRNEVRMQVLQRYSYVNCMVECRAMAIYRRCGCVPYNLPNNGSFRNCEMIDMGCLVDNHDLYTSANPALNSSIAKVINRLRPDCNCLPSCEKVHYPSEMVTGRLIRNFSYNSLAFFKDIHLRNQSVIHVYFADLAATNFRRDIYQDWLGVLASFGGLLGLFLGFSIITCYEVFYFFTIRVLFDVFGKKRVDDVFGAVEG